MILEFVGAGDLDGFLRPKDSEHNMDTFPLQLRILMALDTAKGMRSLHGQHPPIIHRDLRSPNIFVSPPLFPVSLMNSQ